VLPNVKNQTDVEYLATELLSAIEDVAIPGIPLKVSASIGACLVSRHTSEAGEQIIAEADRLMYAAKVAGKKQFRIRDEFPI
jgi:GGDEF domain-containing protein